MVSTSLVTVLPSAAAAATSVEEDAFTGTASTGTIWRAKDVDNSLLYEIVQTKPHLREVDVSGSLMLCGSALLHLGELKYLNTLSLAGTKGLLASRQHVRHFGKLNLTALNLSNTDITAAGMKTLTQLDLTRLACLHLDNCPRKVVEAMRGGLPRLTELSVRCTKPQGRPESVAFLQDRGQLQRLDLSGFPLRPVDLRVLPVLPELRILYMSWPDTPQYMCPARFALRDIALSGLSSVTPRLEQLRMDNWDSLDGSIFKTLANLKRLSSLSVADCGGFRSEMLATLGNLTLLTHLDVSGCQVFPDEDILLAVLPLSLRSLILKRSPVPFSASIFAWLAQAQSLTHVDLSHNHFIESASSELQRVDLSGNLQSIILRNSTGLCPAAVEYVRFRGAKPHRQEE